ncbi:hypothetical protein [Nostocoides japonicum]|uniref:hypothetical protein n=1 Tax=Nostocoides japonicum TaxID=99481 RepID=UPI00065BED5C|nr:hypothetical protein [Tetrasphaera japonica]
MIATPSKGSLPTSAEMLLAGSPSARSSSPSQIARVVRGRLAAEPGYTAAGQVLGIGPTPGAVSVAEIGDGHRFTSTPALAS